MRNLSGMNPRILPAAGWPALLTRLKRLAPEAFDASGRPLNLMGREWQAPGRGKLLHSPLDGTPLGHLPMLDLDAAQGAVVAAASEAAEWALVGLDKRKARVSATISHLQEHREFLAYLMSWEIGKPVRQALVSVDRCIGGVRWYLENVDRMLAGRRPLGLVSNIASWNYPLSVLMHAVLVQVLCGNSIIAKTPTEGGLHTLTLCMALARREGLPVSLISGSGGSLSPALVGHPEVACLSFVGGKTSGRGVVANLRTRRYMLEMEGINAYGVWHFSAWDELAKQLKKGFEYGKQRCTAYPRYVVERSLVPRFLQMYLSVVGSLQVGHTLLDRDHTGRAPDFDFGPLISNQQVSSLREKIADAESKGAIPIFKGKLDPNNFLRGQDDSAYLAPVALLNVPRNCELYHAEPFGPVDTIVVVDTVDELIAEMNVSNGALVASIACDEPETAKHIARELRAFKIGLNASRSRGDRDELFGGVGSAWKGCFVGGELLVNAVTVGDPDERLPGNFDDYTLLPIRR
jgi:acyl-CoA reductase-like NAD-dependent aldehyde dehydrogenase